MKRLICCLMVAIAMALPVSLAFAGPEDDLTSANTLIEQSLAAARNGDLTTAASQYKAFENRWFESTAAGDLVVYAGAARDDQSQGLVAVRTIGAAVGPATVYRTPQRSGAVHIVGAVGRRLSLVSSTGARLAFDVTSRTFGPP